MTRKKLLLALPIVLLLTGVAYVSQATQTDGSKMTAAADKFLSGLNEEQKKKIQFSFDDKERFNWHFVPLQDKNKQSTRKGLRLQEMTEAQRDAARELLKSGTSESGYRTALAIMSLENILLELEKSKANVRNPEWYFFTVFGKPSKAGKWGWRVEGHHLCLNFTVEEGKIVSATPAFFGANPAIVKNGARKGERTLREAEEAAQQLFDSLDPEQRTVALQKAQFKEIPQAVTKPDVGAPVGLASAKMNEKQRELLAKLLQSYADRWTPDVSTVQMAAVKAAGMDKVYFAFAREDNKAGKPYTYRLQGPTFLVEFINVQEDGANNPANHIHSAWRNMKGDFGLTQ